MNRMLKANIAIILCLALIMASCSTAASAEKQQGEKQQNEKSEWVQSAETALPDAYHLALQDRLTWGMPLTEVRDMLGGPFESDFETYLSIWISSAMPKSSDWKGDGKAVKADAFKETDMLSYYAFDESGLLIEYGYQHFSPILEQYDFLKKYYTEKYGKPEKEEYIWRDESYKPTGKENLYDMFTKGQVKVMTVWDIDERDSVLVVDWLSDPVKSQNSFGQISCYRKTGELSLE